MGGIVKHYMWKSDDESTCNPVSKNDIESRFSGMLYSKCDGLLSKGKRKDIHVEKFADSGELNVWQGTEVRREATEITMTFYFTGDNRQSVYELFCKYISNGKIYYWDTMRKKLAYMIFEDAIKPKEDIYKGSIPYIMGEFKFQNLWGECQDIKFN